MRVLVTGGAGFIGSHLAERHLRRGDFVHVVDDLSTGSLDNLAAWLDEPRLDFDQADVLTWPGLAAAVAQADRIYHLAAVVGVFRVLAEPTRVLAVNIAGCERLLRATVEGGRRPEVVLASSSEVYGNSKAPELEEDQVVRIEITPGLRWNYAISKAADEALGMAFAVEHDLPVVIARLFNTVGPRQTGRYGMVLPRFVRQALADEPITVYGDGEQSRCFCDVRDTVEYLDRLIASRPSGGLIANVGNVEEVTIRELAERVRARSGSRSPIENVPYREAYGQEYEDIRRRRPCLDRLRARTSYQPLYTLDDTIDDLIAARRGEPSEVR